ncbi:hypothetical protein RND81_10G125900 [Saponaria officinalis]|uniref:Peptidase A1 domain-containing protein n=1 Tax=Saponaria officinalis TaxID=3572 RepID=A0AAW1I211_SAPOF
MVPIDTPHLGLVPQHFTKQQRHQYLINISLSRPYYNSKLAPNSIMSQVYGLPSSYYATPMVIGEGAAAFSTYLLFDISTDMTWIQCEGCDPCFQVNNNRNFDYSHSPNFEMMSVDDPLCYPRFDRRGLCGYSFTYTKSSTRGIMATDNFIFQNSVTGGAEVYNGYAFGCGFENKDFTFGASTGPRNMIAGVQGLLPGRRSFLNQLEHRIQGRFSYCLPSQNNLSPPMSTMYFGEDAYISGDDDTQVNAIAMDIKTNAYFLYLNGISVDGVRLAIDPSIFEFERIRHTFRGFIIDSGAPYMTLARSAHDPFRDAIVSYFKENYRLKPQPTSNTFEVHYKSNNHDIQFPSIVLHFEGPDHTSEVDMVLNKENMFTEYNYNGEYGFGLMLLPIDDPGPSLLGAFQQSNFKFLFDIPNKILYFVPKICREN